MSTGTAFRFSGGSLAKQHAHQPRLHTPRAAPLRMTVFRAASPLAMTTPNSGHVSRTFVCTAFNRARGKRSAFAALDGRGVAR